MKRIISVFLSIMICFNVCVSVGAYDIGDINTLEKDVGNYIYKTTENPQVGSVGGEWAVLGLARSSLEIPPEYFEKYYIALEEYVKKCGGMLHDKKYTEYSRVVLALTAIGKDPQNVAGYNLLKPLGDYEKTVWQRVNGPVWALIALDSISYEMPYIAEAKTSASREIYVNKILDSQLEDGGWALSGNNADVDLTAMALQALSKYRSEEKVSTAINKALMYLSENQDEYGGFSSRGVSNSESCAQVIVALCELGIDINDERFVKNGYTVFDKMMTYYQKGQGFSHASDDEAVNQMSTEQCFYAIVALKRVKDGKNTLYNMADIIKANEKAIGENISEIVYNMLSKSDFFGRVHDEKTYK